MINMRFKYIGILLVSSFIGLQSCGSSVEKDLGREEGSNEVVQQLDSLVIDGDGIWVREMPVDGEVVMKLDDHTECVVLDTGRVDTIRGCVDYWYQINCNDTVGWVFGSQTSMKSEQSVKTQQFVLEVGSKLSPQNMIVEFLPKNGRENPFVSAIVVKMDTIVIDTITGLETEKIENNHEVVYLMDYTFDGVCDFAIANVGEASNGTMPHFYFVFDLLTKEYKINKTLPVRTPLIELDSLKNELVLYCSYNDCKGNYKFVDGEFKLVSGKYTNDL